VEHCKRRKEEGHKKRETWSGNWGAARAPSGVTVGGNVKRPEEL